MSFFGDYWTYDFYDTPEVVNIGSYHGYYLAYAEPGTGDLLLPDFEYDIDGEPEPDLDPSADPTIGTIWFQYTSDSPGTAVYTVDTGTAGVVVEALIGDSLDTLQQIGVATGVRPTLSVGVPGGLPVYFRVYAQVVPASQKSFDFTVGFSNDPNELIVDVVEDCFQSPGSVMVTVANGQPEDNIYFQIDDAGNLPRYTLTGCHGKNVAVFDFTFPGGTLPDGQFNAVVGTEGTPYAIRISSNSTLDCATWFADTPVVYSHNLFPIQAGLNDFPWANYPSGTTATTLSAGTYELQVQVDPQLGTQYAIDIGEKVLGSLIGSTTFLLSEQFNDRGVLQFCSVPVSVDLTTGAHLLYCSTDVSGNAVVTFQVLSDSFDALSSDTDPTLTGIPDVGKWVFHDPSPDGEQYIFEINPDTMESPFADKTLTADHTTASNGQALEWQGTDKAAQWHISGTLLTQTQYAAFQRFAAKNHRVWIVDHFKRGWVVSVEELDAEPKVHGAAQFPWIHTYRMQLLVFKGPVQL